MAFGSLLAVLLAAGGQGVTALGASSPAPPRDNAGKAQDIAAEQSRSASTGQALGLGSGERLVVKDVITDPDGSTHVRYNRTFNGLPVIGGDLVSHRGNAGNVKSISWNASQDVRVARTTPKISLSFAKAVGARRSSLTQETTSATSGQLIVYAGGATPKLAYDVLAEGVRADQTPSRLHFIVDADTGATLASWDEIENGTGNGIYVGSVPIGTTAEASFSMRDAVGNQTADLHGVNDETGAVTGTLFTDADDLWGNGLVSDRASAGVDAHYGAGKTYDYYKNVHGRNGIMDDGLGARSRVHFGDGYVNAFWDGSQMTYGDGVGNTHPLVELDIAGHEMTHGVTEHTAGLVGDGEAGGLNEATSDIFGTAVEWSVNSLADKPDYLIGELININGDGTPLRYLDRPSRDGLSRDCWSATLGGLDSHFSSGPLNHWFYLASEGSGAKAIGGVSYNSPTCNASRVTGVGRDKVAKIWYRTLTTYLTSNSTYASAREGAIQSARDLYGAASPVCAGIAASFSAIAVPQGALTCGAVASPSGRNILRNPGFEAGPVSWSGTAGPITKSISRPAHTGTWKMWLGGKGVTTTQNQWQSVSIPSTAIAPKLSYWIRSDTAETGSAVFDTMKVQVVSGTTTSTLGTHSNVGTSSTYSQRTFALSAYRGRTITVKFVMSEDVMKQTSFVVDDVAVSTQAGFTGTAPTQVLDTLAGIGAPRAKLGAGSTATVTVPGVPAGATEVALNVTVTGPTKSSYLTVFPAGKARPTASNLNYAPGQTTSNMVMVQLGVGRTVSFYNAAGTVNVIANLVGHFTPATGAGFTGIAPTRVLDTRIGLGAPQARLGARRTLTVTVPGVPAGATAVALNVTVTGSTATSQLTVFPAGTARPTASNLSYAAGKTIPILVLVRLGAGHAVSFYNAAGTVNVMADLVGHFTPAAGAGFTGIAPTRVLDTRIGVGAPKAKLGAGRTLTVTVPGLPAGATTVALNVTATGPTATSQLTVFPAGTARPTMSNLSFAAGQTIPNLVVVRLGAGRTVSFYNAAGTVSLIADLVGYYG